jgi:hypothetical protein
LSAFASDGTATITFKAFKAETGRAVTVAAGGDSASSTSAPFAVAPNQVDHFEFGSPSPAAKAGVQSTVSVAAFDLYENPSTDSLGTPVLSSNLHGSSVGCSGACAETESLSAFASDGTATITFKAFKAETGRTVTVAAGGDSASSTSSPFEVLPNKLDHFTWTTQPPLQTTAGVAFGAVITSYDQYGNVKTNYTPGSTDVSLTGLHNSPSAPTIFGTHAGNLAPSYGTLSWSQGVGTLTNVVDKDAEAPSLTLTNVTNTPDTPAGISAASHSFTIVPASPDALAFTQQPLETQVNNVINATTAPPYVAVQAIDPFGNLASNTSVAVAIGTNPPGNGNLSGTKTQPTNASGIATFNDLKLDQVGIGYTLVANSPPTTPTATKTSNPFVIANTVTTCGTTCSGTAAVPKNTSVTITSDAIPAGASHALTAAPASSSGFSLGIALGLPTQPGFAKPAGVCPGFADAPGGDAGRIDVNSLNSTTGGFAAPTLHFTWRLDKSIVLQIADNGASHYNVCLGAVWLGPPPAVGFPTKGGGTAIGKPDATFPGITVYWGILPDCTTNHPTQPCVQSLKKNGGDEIIAFDVPSPWDPAPHTGT